MRKKDHQEMIGLRYSNLATCFLMLEALGVNRTIKINQGGYQFIETKVALHDAHETSLPEKRRP